MASAAVLVRRCSRQLCSTVRQCSKNAQPHRKCSIISSPLPEITEAYPHLRSYEELHRFSVEQPEKFWAPLARSRLTWQKDFTAAVDHHDDHHYRWFADGQLNAAVNCVDRHAAEHPDRVALLWERDEPGRQEAVTFSQLKTMVEQLSAVMASQGVVAGAAVAVYLPVAPVAVAAMLAAARLGAVHTVVFGGFSAQALADRIRNSGATVLVTADAATRGGRSIPLLRIARDAAAQCPLLRTTLVAAHSGAELQLRSGEIDLGKAMAEAGAPPPPATQGAEDPLFLLYTSGSTGKPKGLVHTTAGYLLYAALTHQLVFDTRPGDVFGCVADVGWITGHSYAVYGPLLNGVTTLLFESTPTYPDPGRYWETVERLGLTHFYCAPTALRLLLRHGDAYVTQYNRDSLRVLGSVGEPINHEAWQWYHRVVGGGKCTVVDTWWQSETGGVMLSPRPSAVGAEVREAHPMRPMLGVLPVLCGPGGEELTGLDQAGALCIASVWPGLARTIKGDHQRYIDTYFTPFGGRYFSGDGALRDADGYYHITGRMDDVINVSGHRLGTAEVEDVLTEHPLVAEAAVVGTPHEVLGEAVCAWVVLKAGGAGEAEGELLRQLREEVKTHIAGYAVPKTLLITSGLPKTRSGKIMRRLLRQIAKGSHDDLGDVSTLADPSVVANLVAQWRAQR